MLADHAGQARVAQALLHGPQGAVPGLHEDQAGGIEAGAGQGRRIKITSRRDPQRRGGTAGQHAGGEQRRGGTAGQHAGGEQRRGGAMLDGGAAGKQLVHGAEGKTLAGQVRIQLQQAEWQTRRRWIGAGPALKRRNPRAQGRNDLRLYRLHLSLLSSYTTSNVS